MAIATKSKTAPEDAFHWSFAGADVTLDDNHSEFQTHDPAVILALQNDPDFDLKLEDKDLKDVGVVETTTDVTTPVAEGTEVHETHDWSDN